MCCTDRQTPAWSVWHSKHSAPLQTPAVWQQEDLQLSVKSSSRLGVFPWGVCSLLNGWSARSLIYTVHVHTDAVGSSSQMQDSSKKQYCTMTQTRAFLHVCMAVWQYTACSHCQKEAQYSSWKKNPKQSPILPEQQWKRHYPHNAIGLNICRLRSVRIFSRSSVYAANI